MNRAQRGPTLSLSKGARERRTYAFLFCSLRFWVTQRFSAALPISAVILSEREPSAARACPELVEGSTRAKDLCISFLLAPLLGVQHFTAALSPLPLLCHPERARTQRAHECSHPSCVPLP